MKISTLTASLLLFASSASAQVVYRDIPSEWENLVEGGQFMDCILPMPAGKLSMDNWGAGSVQPRYIDNGIESAEISYWGGNIIKGDDGLYHLFVSGWAENNPRGHMGWYDASNVYHATCENHIGPFIMQDKLGHGHNTELIVAKDGSFLVYHIGGRGGDEHSDCRFYTSKSLNGPWEARELEWDLRGRTRSDGVGATGDKNWYHNMTFAKREDGSMFMINRGGKAWVSKDGSSKYNLLTDDSVYPFVDGRYEDPVVWRDNIQYHLIVNDWIGRTAFYLRSKDGVNWVVDPGMAYQPGVSVHKDGRVESWYKYERMRVLQDEYGRAMQANFAVIDTIKMNDLPNDNYSSKNISIPLQRGMLLEVLNKVPLTRRTKEIAIKIKGEEGFNPAEVIDIHSLRFGTSSEVNYGRGAKALRGEAAGNDYIVYFEAKGHCITAEEFAPKMIGRKKSGEMIYGYSRLPWVDYKPAILSALKPEIKGGKVSITIENFGLSASKSAMVSLNTFDESGIEREYVAGMVGSIPSYGSKEITFEVGSKRAESDLKSGTAIVIKINTSTEKPSIFRTTL